MLFNSVSDTEIVQCEPGNPEYFKFLAKTAVQLKNESEHSVFEAPCFKNVTYSWKMSNKDEITLTMESKNADSKFCADFYVANVGLHFKFITRFMKGKYDYVFKNLTQEDMDLVLARGVLVFITCDSPSNLMEDLAKTVSLLTEYAPTNFHPLTTYGQEQNRKAAEKLAGIKWKPRKNILNLPDVKDIHSGDVFFIQNFHAFGTMFTYGAGSRSEHIIIALRDPKDNQMWMLESTGHCGKYAINTSDTGVCKTTYDLFMKDSND